MKIIFSRHAKRRARLYNVPEPLVSTILAGLNVQQGEQTIIKEVPGFRYPLKIVVSVDGDTATVITNYPLKKGRKT